MSQKIKSVFLAGLPAIVLATFLVVAIIFAWTEPTSPSPGGNVPAPINVGTTSQIKAGGLGISGGFLVDSPTLVVDAVNDRVGIGTTSPGAKLDIQGGDIKVGSATIKADGSISTGLNAEKVGGKTASELMAAGGGGCGSPTQPPTGCYLTKDFDGDGKMPATGDCDETCNTCFEGSTAYTTSPDGKDQNCNGQIDEGEILICNKYAYWYCWICNAGNPDLKSCGSYCGGCPTNINFNYYCGHLGNGNEGGTITECTQRSGCCQVGAYLYR